MAVTANAFEEDRRRCLDAGMDDYLAKPFDREDLSRCWSAGADGTRAARTAWPSAAGLRYSLMLKTRCGPETTGMQRHPLMS